jgi:hypothetical protein
LDLKNFHEKRKTKMKNKNLKSIKMGKKVKIELNE